MKQSPQLTVPANIDAEKALLGSILLNGELVQEAQQVVQLEDFFTDGHRRIFMAMAILSHQGKAIDAITLSDELNRAGMLEAAGGIGYLSQLIVGVPHTQSLMDYAVVVADKAKARRLMIASQRCAAKLMANEKTAEVMAELESELLDLLDAKASVRTLPQIGYDFLKGMEKLRSMDRETLGMTYGVQSLDDLTTGIREADYILLAGRSGGGKSALARRIAYANAKARVPVAIFTPEVTAEQFFSMLVPLESPIPYWKVRDPRQLNPSEFREVMAVTERISELPLWIDDTSGISIAELTAKAKMQIGKGARLVIVDYLQLVTAPGAKTERDRVNEISAGLRHLAKATQVPVIALSQLARPAGRDVNERPTMYHLKESGNLEQDAFVVLLLYRPQDEQGFTGQDEIIIAKQRFGEAGCAVPVQFDKHRVTYSERA